MGLPPKKIRIRLAPVFFFFIYTLVIYFLLWNYECGGFPGYGYYVTITSSLFGFFSKDVTDANFFLVPNKTRSIYTNPVYDKFYIKPPRVKKHVTILIFVASTPSRIAQRKMIRETWWSRCRKPTNFGVIPECLFMVEYQGPGDRYFHQVHSENVNFNDVHLQLVPSNHTARVFLYHLLYANTMYEYDYLLRVSDEQFLCLDEILRELPRPMERYFHWGVVYSRGAQKVPDEKLLLLSRDTVHTFLRQESKKMLCHPHVGSMISIWVNKLRLDNLLRHDKRISSEMFGGASVKDTNVCKKIIAYQGVTADTMKMLWRNVQVQINSSGNLKSHSSRDSFRPQNELSESEHRLCIEETN